MHRFERDESSVDSEKLWAYIEALKREGGPSTEALNGHQTNSSRPAAGPAATHGSDARETAETETLLPLTAALYKVMQAEATSGQSAARARLNAVIQADLADADPRDPPLTFDPAIAVVPGQIGPRVKNSRPRRRWPVFFAPLAPGGAPGPRVRTALVALVLLLLALAAFGRLYSFLTPEACHETPTPHGPK